MEATVTKNASQRHQWAKEIGKVLFFGAFLTMTSTASARSPIPNAGYGTDFTYVQAPGTSPLQPNIYQPVITPREIPAGEWDQVGHLWPRLVSYSMETDSIEAYVQADLRVGMQYNYSFNFELGARNGQGRGMPIPEGWYQLQVAVIKKSGAGLRNKSTGNVYDRYVTSTSLFLKVSNGSFGRKIALRFPDFTQTSLKHHLFVELIPLKEECENNGQKIRCINVNAKGEPDANRSILEPRDGYKTYLVEMPFIPFQPNGGKIRDADDLSDKDQAFLGGSLAKYIARAQLYKNKNALKAQENVSPADHARKHKLNLKNISDPSLQAAAPMIRKIFDAKTYGVMHLNDIDKSAYTAICAQLVAHQAEFQARHKRMQFQRERDMVIKNHIQWCAKDPEHYMRLNRVLHVGKAVTGKIERIAQKSLTYTIMSNYMASRSQSLDSVSSISVKPPGILVGFTEQIGLGFGHSVNFVNGRSQAETGIASMSTSLDFNYVLFNVPTVGSQQCLEIRPLKDTYGFFFDKSTDASNGLYICADKDDSVIETPEIYAHAFERCRDTTMMECDTLTQSVNVSVRGERDLSAFFYAIRGGITPDHDNRVMPFGNLESAEQYFANIPLVDDMEIVTPVEFPRERIPSFIKMISGQHREF